MANWKSKHQKKIFQLQKDNDELRDYIERLQSDKEALITAYDTARADEKRYRLKVITVASSGWLLFILAMATRGW